MLQSDSPRCHVAQGVENVRDQFRHVNHHVFFRDVAHELVWGQEVALDVARHIGKFIKKTDSC